MRSIKEQVHELLGSRYERELLELTNYEYLHLVVLDESGEAMRQLEGMPSVVVVENAEELEGMLSRRSVVVVREFKQWE